MITLVHYIYISSQIWNSSRENETSITRRNLIFFTKTLQNNNVSNNTGRE
jgi:hypothetical protein